MTDTKHTTIKTLAAEFIKQAQNYQGFGEEVGELTYQEIGEALDNILHTDPNSSFANFANSHRKSNLKDMITEKIHYATDDKITDKQQQFATAVAAVSDDLTKSILKANKTKIEDIVNTTNVKHNKLSYTGIYESLEENNYIITEKNLNFFKESFEIRAKHPNHNTAKEKVMEYLLENTAIKGSSPKPENTQAKNTNLASDVNGANIVSANPSHNLTKQQIQRGM